MKLVKFLICMLVLAIVSIFYTIAKDAQAKQHLAIQQFVGDANARIMWSESMSDGTSRHFTYWNNDHCVGTVVTKGEQLSYVRQPHCSNTKLTK